MAKQLSTFVTKEQLAKLTTKERAYFNIMFAKSGVLYITSKPGLAKSSYARSIAQKLDMQYMDIRLSMVDETDIGLYPCVGKEEVGEGVNKTSINVLDFAVPKWAIKANRKPTIIHFEEMNRASLPVRNAALQLLLERCIGTEFSFADHVLMMSSGNLGEEDGTDVEEFDSALNNRLIHVKHDMSPQEWIEAFANENVHPLVVSFIKAYPEEYYKRGKEDAKAYATPRSWTFLSDFIISSLFMENRPSNDTDFVKTLVQANAHSYIGNSQVKFVKYLEETMSLNINDILNNYDRVATRLTESNRDKKSELLGSLREMELKKLKPNQVDNLIKFLQILNEDECVGFLTWIIDNGMDDDLKKPPFGTILKAFKPLLTKISQLS